MKEDFTKSWKRNLDDCFIFIFWKYTRGDINELHELLQNLHTKIKFIMEHILKELPFLDILVKNVNGKIITDFYHKPTDTQQYIHFRTPSTKNCIKSIPYTLARRIHTIIIDKDLKKNTPQRTTHNSTPERIPKSLINKGLELAEKIPLRELSNPKNTKTKNPNIRHNLQQK